MCIIDGGAEDKRWPLVQAQAEGESVPLMTVCGGQRVEGEAAIRLR
jgi:hypothetical protein